MLSKITISRIIKYGFLNLWRNRWLSITAISVMTITLLVISSLLVINQLAGLSAQNLQARVDISVFLNSDTSAQKLKEIETDLKTIEEISSIKFIPADLALAEFRERHKDDPLIQQTLETLGENPLQPMFIITANDLNHYPIIYQKIEKSRFQPFIYRINFEDVRPLIEKLKQITSGIRNIGITVTLTFGLIAVLVMFNTLRLTIFGRKEEIEIMRLVGASNSYIRGPFLIEGILYGLIATVLASLVFFPALMLSASWITRFFGLDLSASTYFGRGFWQIMVAQVLSGTALGVVSSVIATRKHLQV